MSPATPAWISSAVGRRPPSRTIATGRPRAAGDSQRRLGRIEREDRNLVLGHA